MDQWSFEEKENFAEMVMGMSKSEIISLCSVPPEKWNNVDIKVLDFVNKQNPHGYSAEMPKGANIITHDADTFLYGKYKNKVEYNFSTCKKIHSIGKNKEYELIYNDKPQALFIRLNRMVLPETVEEIAQWLTDFCQTYSDSKDLYNIISRNSQTGEHDVFLPEIALKNGKEKCDVLNKFEEWLGDNATDDIKLILKQNTKLSKEPFVKRVPPTHDYYVGEEKNLVTNLIDSDIHAYASGEDTFKDVLNRTVASMPEGTNLFLQINQYIGSVHNGDVIVNNYNCVNKTDTEITKDYINHIKENKPDWYEDNTWVEVGVMIDDVNKFSGKPVYPGVFSKIAASAICQKRARRINKNGSKVSHFLLKAYDEII